MSSPTKSCCSSQSPQRDPADSSPYFAVLWPNDIAVPLALTFPFPTAQKPRSSGLRRDAVLPQLGGGGSGGRLDLIDRPTSASKTEKEVKPEPVDALCTVMTRGRKRKLEQEGDQLGGKLSPGEFFSDLRSGAGGERGPQKDKQVKTENGETVGMGSDSFAQESSEKRGGGRGVAARDERRSGGEGCTAEGGATCRALRVPKLEPGETDGSGVARSRKRCRDSGGRFLSKSKLPKVEPGEPVLAVVTRNRKSESEQEECTQSGEVAGGQCGAEEGEIDGAALTGTLSQPGAEMKQEVIDLCGSPDLLPVTTLHPGRQSGESLSEGVADAGPIWGGGETKKRPGDGRKRDELSRKGSADNVFLNTRARAYRDEAEVKDSLLAWGGSGAGASGRATNESGAQTEVVVKRERVDHGLEVIHMEDVSLRRQLDMRRDLCAYHERDLVKVMPLARLPEGKRKRAGFVDRKVRGGCENKVEPLCGGTEAGGSQHCECSTCLCPAEGAVYFTVLVREAA